MNDLANFAADLRRIAYWIHGEQNKLAKIMLKKTRELYEDVDPKISCYKNIWSEIEKIERLEGGKNRAAERALTASVILLNETVATIP